MGQQLSASLEMYLKAIYVLSRQNDAVHAKDIAWQLEVTRPSVTGALRQLAEKELVNYSPYEAVTLTAEGVQLAKGILERYEVLHDFLSRVLSIESKEATEIACEMEHAIPGKVLSRLVSFLDYMASCPRGNVVWVDQQQGFFCHKQASCTEGDKIEPQKK